MKKLVILIITLCYSLAIFSQSSNLLDDYPGYKNLKLGTPISSLSNILQFVQVTSSGGNMYRIKDNSYLSIYGVKMDDITIFSANDVVTGIYMVKRSLPGAILDPLFQEKIQNGMIQQYGSPQFDMTDENANPPRNGVAWRTKNKEAHVCTYYFSDQKLFSLTVFWGLFGE